MSQKRLWLSAAIISLVIVGGFVISVPRTSAPDAPDTALQAGETVAPATPIVALRDVYKKGLHTITGSIAVPTVCSTVTAEASLSGEASSTQSILVDLTQPADNGVCLQIPTEATFTVSIAAPAGLEVTARVNGVLASTTRL